MPTHTRNFSTATVPLQAQRRPKGRLLSRILIVAITAVIIGFSCMGLLRGDVNRIAVLGGDLCFLITMCVLWRK